MANFRYVANFTFLTLLNPSASRYSCFGVNKLAVAREANMAVDANKHIRNKKMSNMSIM